MLILLVVRETSYLEWGVDTHEAIVHETRGTFKKGEVRKDFLVIN